MIHGKAEFKPNQILTPKKTTGMSPCLLNAITSSLYARHAASLQHWEKEEFKLQRGAPSARGCRGESSMPLQTPAPTP